VGIASDSTANGIARPTPRTSAGSSARVVRSQTFVTQQAVNRDDQRLIRPTADPVVAESSRRTRRPARAHDATVDLANETLRHMGDDTPAVAGRTRWRGKSAEPRRRARIRPRRGNFATPASARLYQTAMSCLGRDASPSDKANDEFACAESVNEVVFKAFNDYAGGDLSTTRMYLALANNKKFAKITSPLGRHRHLTYRLRQRLNAKRSRRHHWGQRPDHVQQLGYRPVGHPLHFSFMEGTLRRPGGFPMVYYRRMFM
jgi:hypothetical protein